MSAEAQAYVWKSSPYVGVKRCIHLAIADIVNDTYENKFWMAQSALAEKAGCSRKHVNDTLDEMCNAGYLVCVERNAKQNKPNVYRFLFPEIEVSPEVQEVSPEVTPGVTFEPVGVTSGYTILNRTQEELKEKEIRAISVASRNELGWRMFWQAWPRKINKKKAEQAFMSAAKRADAHEIAKSAVRWSKHWKETGQELQFIPHATTWLNADRWNDEPEAVDKAKTALKGNAQAGKNFLTFDYEDDIDLVTKLGAEVFGVKS